jgi:hypothetical protein
MYYIILKFINYYNLYPKLVYIIIPLIIPKTIIS